MSTEPPELSGLHELLAGLPRTKVTPDNITQVMIDRWYETERERIKQIGRLQKERDSLAEVMPDLDTHVKLFDEQDPCVDWCPACLRKRAEEVETKMDALKAACSDEDKTFAELWVHAEESGKRAEEAERLAASCTCGTPGLDYEGPQADCAVHGAIRAFDEASRRLTAAIALLRLAHHIRMYGEYAPGGTENWGDWDREAEQFLREEL